MTSSTHDLVPRTHTTSGISPAPYREGVSLYPAPGELVEHVLIQSLTLVAGPHRQEDVSPDELMHNLAVCGETMKRDLLVEADLDLLDLPVDVPRLHVLEAPSLGRVARVHVHQRHAVRPDTQQLLGGRNGRRLNVFNEFRARSTSITYWYYAQSILLKLTSLSVHQISPKQLPLESRNSHIVHMNCNGLHILITFIYIITPLLISTHKLVLAMGLLKGIRHNNLQNIC